MKAGQTSQTAEMVCVGRAIAHGRSSVARFQDPTALTLLSDEGRARVERVRAGGGTGWANRLRSALLERRSSMMVARTVAIDDAVRAALVPQVVILGAGLDGRAWRMPELRDTVVFEVDHPDSQREKRSRVATLMQAAREVRFVPVDFTRDSLDGALASAGHDSVQRTVWIWEGVVMYLTLPEIEASLATMRDRSASGSRVVIAYHAPSFVLRLLGFTLRRVGEPLRSAFKPAAMRALLAKYSFGVLEDRALPEIGAQLSLELGRAVGSLGHLRIVIAERG